MILLINIIFIEILYKCLQYCITSIFPSPSGPPSKKKLNPNNEPGHVDSFWDRVVALINFNMSSIISSNQLLGLTTN